jgi:hypothetical protein
MPFPRLTWAGLLLATLGWGLLLAYPLIASLGGGGPESNAIRDPARFILIFGENAVITGFAVALLGAMEKMINLLGRQAATMHPGKANGRAPQLAHHQLQNQQFAAHQLSNNQLQGQQQLSPNQLMTPRQTNEVVTRGALSGRDYVLFRDGSVVVETLLGPRRFLSLGEAQEFIGTS